MTISNPSDQQHEKSEKEMHASAVSADGKSVSIAAERSKAESAMRSSNYVSPDGSLAMASTSSSSSACTAAKSESSSKSGDLSSSGSASKMASSSTSSSKSGKGKGEGEA